jgi:hypothetical protein
MSGWLVELYLDWQKSPSKALMTDWGVNLAAAMGCEMVSS